jgi:hypothetical protein
MSVSWPAGEHASPPRIRICADTLLAPDTIRHLERLIRRKAKPERFAPVYAYA